MTPLGSSVREQLSPDRCDDLLARPPVTSKKIREFHGKVVSGRGDFGFWIERLNHFYEQKTGMRLYPGTLNLELSSAYSLTPDMIRLEAGEYRGRVSVSIVSCCTFDRWAFLLRADENERGTGHHLRNIVEITTNIRLRDAYKLHDGD